MMMLEAKTTKTCAEQAQQVIDGAWMVTRNDCVLWTQDGRYCMEGLGSKMGQKHSLDVSSTDLARLAAHWADFCDG